MKLKPIYRHECKFCKQEFDEQMKEFESGNSCGYTYGGGYLPCGGCDSCIAAQITHNQEKRHEFINRARRHGLLALHYDPICFDITFFNYRYPEHCSWHIGRKCNAW